jgi:glutamyl-Q tRNA(Asp) synthetase
MKCRRHGLWQNSAMSSRASDPSYRGRFAPTPSGPLHFGSLVAAVGSFLEARCRGGAWLLRIDDLDPPRVVPGALQDILRTLEAFGLHWDGEVICQSRRADAYHAALHRLREPGHVYPCGCSRREIADSATTGIDGLVYPGTCRSGLKGERRARTLRLRVGAGTIAFEDAVQGRFAQDVAAQVGDFVLYRAERVFAYQLAVVVDDAWQGITDIVRGADLLDSTPRQIVLQRLLGWPTPRYAHLPVVVTEQGEKLSKQTLAAPVDARDPAPALWQALDFLGQGPSRDLERARLRDIWSWALEAWDLGRVPRNPAVPARSGPPAEAPQR